MKWAFDVKHSTVQELFKYWDHVRGRRQAPERDEIDPGAIRRILPDTFILGIDERSGHPFRLAGTRVCAIFGHELRNRPMMHLWDRSSVPSFCDLISVVSGEAVGVSAGLTGYAADGCFFELEILILPLSRQGRFDSRAIGVLVPTTPPYWLGIHPVIRMTLNALRYVGDAAETELQQRIMTGTQPAVPPLAMPVGGRIRRGLIVYEGGRRNRGP